MPRAVGRRYLPFVEHSLEARSLWSDSFVRLFLSVSFFLFLFFFFFFTFCRLACPKRSGANWGKPAKKRGETGPWGEGERFPRPARSVHFSRVFFARCSPRRCRILRTLPHHPHAWNRLSAADLLISYSLFHSAGKSSFGGLFFNWFLFL